MDFKNIQSLTLEELRNQWENAWRMKPHKYIGRKMLERSLAFKRWEQNNQNSIRDKQKQLNKAITAYKRDRGYFNNPVSDLDVGTKLVRVWKGKKYVVIITKDGFEYNGDQFSSLSSVANFITGSRWNGYVFFGLKK